jgi:hypothetical protein
METCNNLYRKVCTCSLPKTLSVLQLTKKLHDVSFIIDEHQFHTHKILLIAYCSKIRDMLLETSPHNHTVIKLFEATKQGMDLVLSYIYELKIKIYLFNFADILITSSELGINDLIEISLTFIDQYFKKKEYQKEAGDFINNDIGCITRAIGILFSLREKYFYKILKEYVIDNFKRSVNTKEFLQLNFKVFHDLLSDRSIKEIYRICVYNAIVQWIQYDKTVRYKYHEKLLKTSQFKYSSDDFIKLQKKIMYKDHTNLDQK